LSNYHNSIHNFLIELQNSIYAVFDYKLIIFLITFILLCGIVAYGDVFKSHVFQIGIFGIGGFLFIKTFHKILYDDIDQQFILILVEFLGLLFLGYLLLLQEEDKEEHIRFEYPTLLLIAIFGILVTLENTEGLIIFLGLEIQAFTYYTIVSMKEKEILSAEGALKYFLIGAIASGLFILGLGLIYGIVAKTNFVTIAEIFEKNGEMLLNFGGLIIITGLMFKIGAAPFHLWLPDAYQGANFYVLLFLITFPKLVLFYLIFTINSIFQENTIIMMTLVLSSIIGSIQASSQTKIKRFIAYTIIFNNSYFLGLMVMSGRGAFYSLLQSLMLYLIITLTTALAFFMLKNSENNMRLLTLRDLISLKKSNIFLALVIMLGFFSSAGIPPFIGFFQKYLILLALSEKLQVFIMVFLILSSILPAYYYIRISKIIFFMPNSKFMLLKDNTKVTATILCIIFCQIIAVFY
jgi:NADH-quinone oxidoreductase subunit N